MQVFPVIVHMPSAVLDLFGKGPLYRACLIYEARLPGLMPHSPIYLGVLLSALCCTAVSVHFLSIGHAFSAQSNTANKRKKMGQANTPSSWGVLLSSLQTAVRTPCTKDAKFSRSISPSYTRQALRRGPGRAGLSRKVSGVNSHTHTDIYIYR